jgi:hypothetical protein
MSVWGIVFAVMSATQGVGDQHPGQWLPFWQRACDEGRPRACAYVAELESIFCGAGSGWACNEIGILRGESRIASFDRGCRLGFLPACRNSVRASNDDLTFERAPPTVADYPIVLRGSKGPIPDRSGPALLARACEQGWPDTCGR